MCRRPVVTYLRTAVCTRPLWALHTVRQRREGVNNKTCGGGDATFVKSLCPLVQSRSRTVYLEDDVALLDEAMLLEGAEQVSGEQQQVVAVSVHHERPPGQLVI